MSIERRTRPTEFRADGEGDGFTTSGHAATYDEPYDLGPFDERIARGAFDGAIESDDVRALWNHDSSNVLGRTKAGTLRLSSDKVGLLSEIDFPATAVRERESVERGDVDQMSFGFSVVRELWEEDKEGRELRTILEAKLYDVSPVAFPANESTDLSIAERSLAEWRNANPSDTKTVDSAGTPEPDPEPEGMSAEARERELELRK